MLESTLEEWTPIPSVRRHSTKTKPTQLDDIVPWGNEIKIPN